MSREETTLAKSKRKGRREKKRSTFFNPFTKEEGQKGSDILWQGEGGERMQSFEEYGHFSTKQRKKKKRLPCGKEGGIRSDARKRNLGGERDEGTLRIPHQIMRNKDDTAQLMRRSSWQKVSL